MQRAAPAAIAKTMVRSPRDSASVRGRDRIAHVADITTFKDGQAVISVVFNAHTIPRLAVLAQGYQRVKFNRVTFRIISQSPSIVTGGYIAGFLADGADATTSITAQSLITNTGARSAAWWQPSTINIPRSALGRTYYTNAPESGADSMRTYSPGSLVVIAEGKPTGTGPISVEVSWEATLSGATLQDKPAAAGSESSSLRVQNSYANPLKDAARWTQVQSADKSWYSGVLVIEQPDLLGVTNYVYAKDIGLVDLETEQPNGLVIRLPDPVLITRISSDGKQLVLECDYLVPQFLSNIGAGAILVAPGLPSNGNIVSYIDYPSDFEFADYSGSPSRAKIMPEHSRVNYEIGSKPDTVIPKEVLEYLNSSIADLNLAAGSQS